MTNISKLSFQYGFSVFLITPVVCVCSPLTVATAKGSGNPAYHSQSSCSIFRVRGGRTEKIPLVQAISGNDCKCVRPFLHLKEILPALLVTLRLGLLLLAAMLSDAALRFLFLRSKAPSSYTTLSRMQVSKAASCAILALEFQVQNCAATSAYSGVVRRV